MLKPSMVTRTTTKHSTKDAPQLMGAKKRLINHLWNAAMTTCVTKVITSQFRLFVCNTFFYLNLGVSIFHS